MGRRVLWIFAAAAAIRVAFALLAPGVALSDGRFYHMHAAVLQGTGAYLNGDGSPAIRWMPGWPALLAVGEVTLVVEKEAWRSKGRPGGRRRNLWSRRNPGVEKGLRMDRGRAGEAQYRFLSWRIRSNEAVSATAMTDITPACTGSETTRSAASGTLPAMFSEIT